MEQSESPKAGSRTPFRNKVEVWVYTRPKADPKSDEISVLILRTTEARGGFWQPVTGGVERRENLAQAALREAEEETGLQFENDPIDLHSSFDYEGRGSRFREHGFALEATSSGAGLPEIFLDPHEHVEYRWVSTADALKMIRFSANADMLRVLLKKLGTKT